MDPLLHLSLIGKPQVAAILAGIPHPFSSNHRGSFLWLYYKDLELPNRRDFHDALTFFIVFADAVAKRE